MHKSLIICLSVLALVAITLAIPHKAGYEVAIHHIPHKHHYGAGHSYRYDYRQYPHHGYGGYGYGGLGGGYGYGGLGGGYGYGGYGGYGYGGLGGGFF